MTLNAFVYIIESPSNLDLLDERTEGRLLSEAFKIAGIQHKYNLASNKEMFIEALCSRLPMICNQLQELPILHLTMHGNKNGIQLTSGDFLTWNELYQLILPLKRYMNGNLLICMSSCEGFYAISMEMNIDGEPPLFALVGSPQTVGYHDSAIAYTTFYHLFFKGKNIEECVQAMRIASGDSNFDFQFGVTVKDLTFQHIQTSFARILQYQNNQINQRRFDFMGDYS
jgi:hypothetical protein